MERAGILLHLIDGTQEDVVLAYKTIRKELKAYSPELAKKPELVALNKCDALTEDEIKEKSAALKKASKKKIWKISGVSGEGVKDVLREMMKAIDESKAAEEGVSV